jgi:hypothetical protein
MGKATTKRRKQKPADDEQTIFEQLNNVYADAPEQEQEQEQQDTGTDDQQVDQKALLAQIATLNSQIDALRAPLPVVQEPSAPSAPGAMSLENLPDPMQDPEGYARELQTRMDKHYQDQRNYEQFQTQQTQKAANRTSELWQTFAIDYEPYSADKTKAEFAAQQVARAAQAKGIDVEKYMFQHTDRFLSEVAKVYDKTFGKPGAEEEDEQDDRPANRTAGIFGGAETGGRPSKGVQPQDDMIKDLHKLQQKMGLY